jgi:hypothetical protein
MTTTTAIKERPILFGGPMVRAILEGRKTQTRRLPSVGNSYVDGSRAKASFWKMLDWQSSRIFVDPGPSPAGNAGPYLHVPDLKNDCVHRVYPEFGVGERLWVREEMRCGPSQRGANFYYEADKMGVGLEVLSQLEKRAFVRDYIPSIHMPRLACRIKLVIVKVRVERLQEIDSGDANAEGFQSHHEGACHFTPRNNFRTSWDSHNAAPCDWVSNPWVWVVEFKRV